MSNSNPPNETAAWRRCRDEQCRSKQRCDAAPFPCVSAARHYETADPTSGDRCYISGPHVWAGNCGEVLRFERYGAGGMFSGWRVRLDCGDEVYAQAKDIVRQ